MIVVWEKQSVKSVIDWFPKTHIIFYIWLTVITNFSPSSSLVIMDKVNLHQSEFSSLIITSKDVEHNDC